MQLSNAAVAAAVVVVFTVAVVVVAVDHLTYCRCAQKAKHISASLSFVIAQKVSEALWPAAAAAAFSRVNSNSTAAAQGSVRLGQGLWQPGSEQATTVRDSATLSGISRHL